VIYARSNLEESWGAIRRGGNRINLLIPEMLEELLRIQQEGPVRDEDFPFILSAGERRSETTNTVIRDATWHKHVPARLEKPACVGWVRVKTKSG
jgi:hypothetical protein